MKEFFVTSLILFVIFHFILILFPSVIAENLLSGAGFFLILSAFLSMIMNKKPLLKPLVILSIALLITLFTSSHPLILWDGLRQMRDVIPLVILISLAGWIVNDKPYMQALLQLSNGRIKKNTQVFSFTSIITHFVSSFMTTGGIAFVYQLLDGEKGKNINKEAWHFTNSTAIMRGYSLTVLWTTVHPAFAYIISGTKAPLFETMLQGFGLAIIGMVLGLMVFQFQFKKREWNPVLMEHRPQQDGDRKSQRKLILGFSFWVLVIMLSIFSFYYWLSMNILLAVPLSIVFVVTLYFFLSNKIRKYLHLWKQMIRQDFPKKDDQMALILSAGLFVSVLKGSGLGRNLFQSFLAGVDILHIDLLIGLSLVVILLGFFGLPPIPAMVLLSGILVDLPAGYTPEQVALSLALGVSITLMVAPITVPLLIISSLNNRSIYENGFSWNLFFGLILFVVGQIYIQLLRIIG